MNSQILLLRERTRCPTTLVPQLTTNNSRVNCVTRTIYIVSFGKEKEKEKLHTIRE